MSSLPKSVFNSFLVDKLTMVFNYTCKYCNKVNACTDELTSDHFDDNVDWIIENKPYMTIYNKKAIIVIPIICKHCGEQQVGRFDHI